MNKYLRVSPKGVSLLKQFEGLELEAYQDIARVWTIAYGHTEGFLDGTFDPDTVITAKDAEALLKADLRIYEEAVRTLASIPLNQNEFDALVSFTYNIGVEAFMGSTARKRLNRGDKLGAADAMTWWNKATVDGALREVLGLTRRRAAEKALFLKPIETTVEAHRESNARPTKECRWRLPLQSRPMVPAA